MVNEELKSALVNSKTEKSNNINNQKRNSLQEPPSKKLKRRPSCSNEHHRNLKQEMSSRNVHIKDLKNIQKFMQEETKEKLKQTKKL